jgi:hypothetical protein
MVLTVPKEDLLKKEARIKRANDKKRKAEKPTVRIELHYPDDVSRVNARHVKGKQRIGLRSSCCHRPRTHFLLPSHRHEIWRVV